jgi:hypothetical protein
MTAKAGLFTLRLETVLTQPLNLLALTSIFFAASAEVTKPMPPKATARATAIAIFFIEVPPFVGLPVKASAPSLDDAKFNVSVIDLAHHAPGCLTQA